MSYLLDDLMGFEKTANAAWRKPARPSTKEEYETERKNLHKNLIRSAVGVGSGLALSRIPYSRLTDRVKRRDWEKVVQNSTPENFEAIRDKHGIFSKRMNDVATYAPLSAQMITMISASNLMNNAYRAAHLKLKYGKRFNGMQEQEKTAGDVVDFAAHAKKKAIKAEFANPKDPIKDAQRAIQEYLNKEKEWQADSKARKAHIADLEMGIKSDMEQLRQIEAREAKIGLRNKKLAVGAGIGTAATIGGLYAYNRYKKKKRAEQEKTAGTIRYDAKGNPMVSMYDEGSIPYIDRYEKNKRTIKRVGPGIAMTGLGAGLDSLKEKFPNSAAKNIPDKLSNGLILGGMGLAAAGGTYNYIKERNRNKRIAAHDQEKSADLE